VGKSLTVCVLLVTALSFLNAQDQEGKLVDRLLRPDMTLQNTVQNKKFIADGTYINKQATVGTFYVQKKSNSKSFSGTRDFSARQFSSQSFQGTRGVAGTSKVFASSPSVYASRSSRDVRDAPQSDKRIASDSFAGNRPFVDQGKSQKSLNRKNPPLTIEQVRELLNKNK
jgi:hypothetical protein